MAEDSRARGRRLLEEYLEAADSLREMIRRAANLSAGETPVPRTIDHDEWNLRKRRLDDAHDAWRQWLASEPGD